MDPNLRRYFPALVVLLLVGVAVYMGQPDTLTGSAAGSGCAGASGQLPDAIVEVGGETDEGAAEAVMKLIAIDVNDTSKQGQVAALAEARQEVSEFGGVAVPAILDELQASGCNEAASGDLIDLLGDLGGMNQFAGQAQMKMALLLLDVSISAVEGEDAERQFRDPNSISDQEEADRMRCAEEAGVVVTNWYASTKSDEDQAAAEAQSLAIDIMGRIKDLPAGDFTAHRLVQMLDGVAEISERWAKEFENLTMEGSLHAEARGAACSAAVSRKSDLSLVRESFKEIEEAPVLVCAIKASAQWGTDSYILHGLVAEDAKVRMASIVTAGKTGSLEHVAPLSEMLFATDINALETEEERNEEKTQQLALIESIAVLVVRDGGDPTAALAVTTELSVKVSNGSILIQKIRDRITEMGGDMEQPDASDEGDTPEEDAGGESDEGESDPGNEGAASPPDEGGEEDPNDNSEEEDAAEGEAAGDGK